MTKRAKTTESEETPRIRVRGHKRVDHSKPRPNPLPRADKRDRKAAHAVACMVTSLRRCWKAMTTGRPAGRFYYTRVAVTGIATYRIWAGDTREAAECTVMRFLTNGDPEQVEIASITPKVAVVPAEHADDETKVVWHEAKQ